MWWLSLLQQKLPHKPRWNRFEKLFCPISHCILFLISKCIFYFIPNFKMCFLPKPTASSTSVTILRRGQMAEYGRDFFKRNFSEYVNGFGIDKEGHGLSHSFSFFVFVFVFVFVFEINKGCLCLWMSTNLGSTKVVMVYLALCILEFPKFQSLNSDFWVSLFFTISVSKY